MLKRTEDLNELRDFAMRMMDKRANGKIYVNQSNYNSEEPILSDEDISGRQSLQMLRIVIQTNDESIYYEYLFSEALNLEEMNIQLEELYNYFNKEIVSVEYMNDLVRFAE